MLAPPTKLGNAERFSVRFEAPSQMVPDRSATMFSRGVFRAAGHRQSVPEAVGTQTEGIPGILIASSLPVIARGLESWFGDTSRGWIVVGTCTTTEEVVRDSARPAVAIVVATDELDGVELSTTLRQTAPAVVVLVLTDAYGAAREADLARAGIAGVLDIRATRGQLIRAIGRLLSGDSVISAAALRLVTDSPEPPGPQLTSRQVEVLGLLREGLSTGAMADRLVVTPSTIKTHIRRIGERLGLPGRHLLAVHADDLLRQAGSAPSPVDSPQ